MKEDQPDGSRVIKCGELSFKGPVDGEFELRHAYVRAVGTAAQFPFGDVRPHQRGELNSDGLWKNTTGKVDKKGQISAFGGEINQRGGKLSASLSKTTGEDRSNAWETTRNGLKINHRRDAVANSVEITYTPAHQNSAEDLIVVVDDLPNITIPPEGSGPKLGAVAIRTLSTWRLRPHPPPGSVKLWEKVGARLPWSKEKPALEYRGHVDVAFCAEITVAVGALGNGRFSTYPDTQVPF